MDHVSTCRLCTASIVSRDPRRFVLAPCPRGSRHRHTRQTKSPSCPSSHRGPESITCICLIQAVRCVAKPGPTMTVPCVFISSDTKTNSSALVASGPCTLCLPAQPSPIHPPPPSPTACATAKPSSLPLSRIYAGLRRRQTLQIGKVRAPSHRAHAFLREGLANRRVRVRNKEHSLRLRNGHCAIDRHGSGGSVTDCPDGEHEAGVDHVEAGGGEGSRKRWG